MGYSVGTVTVVAGMVDFSLNLSMVLCCFRFHSYSQLSSRGLWVSEVQKVQMESLVCQIEDQNTIQYDIEQMVLPVHRW